MRQEGVELFDNWIIGELQVGAQIVLETFDTW